MIGHNSIVEQLKFDITEVADKVSNKDYHSRSEISSSFIKAVHKHSVGSALAPPPAETPQAFLFGDAFHEYMELGYLSDRFAIKPDDYDGRTKAGKDWMHENGDKVTISAKEYAAIEGMHASAINHPTVKKLLEDENLERRDEWSFFADGDDENLEGVSFRVRPDVHFVNKKSGMIDWIVDWKSCLSIKQLIKWGFMDLGYDVQDVFYSDFMGVNPRNFLFVCTEKSFPYSTRVLRLSEDSISTAREKTVEAILKIRVWLDDPTKIDMSMPDVIEL
jgi:hypothetical protein